RVLLVAFRVAQLADLPPPLGKLENRVAWDLDSRVVAGAEAERGVLRVGVVAGGGAFLLLLDRHFVDDLGLALLLAGILGGARDDRTIARRRRAADELGGLAVRPLAVLALVVDEELGALPDLALVLHAVELLEEHRQERDLVGALHRRGHR